MHQDPAARRELESSTQAVETSISVPELDTFAQQGLITRVHAQLQSGKEGTVYCCRAHPSTNRKFLAAKVYRAHSENAYKWDPTYFQGRERLLKVRTVRAIQARSTYGKRVAEGLWVGTEYGNLRQMAAFGVRVPAPIALSDRAILMEYIGNGAGPAPHLDGVEMQPEAAHALCEQILGDIRLLLSHHLVHGDLSPYNILVWKDAPWIIDVPQAVDVRFNESAFLLLQRDVERIGVFFQRYGIENSPLDLVAELWERYRRAQL